MRFILAIVFILVLLAGAAGGFIWSGAFNISALVPHWDTTTEMIALVRDRSILVHSRDVTMPTIREPGLLAKGVSEYHHQCRFCHGAPGVSAETFAQGLYPAAADLLSGLVQKEWNDNHLYWIVENGLKMTGMPAFGTTHEKEEIAAIVVFLRRLPGMSPEEYNELTGGPAGS
ncbi:MAG: cytochrome c [Syntrophobacteraceae bacterium]